LSLRDDLIAQGRIRPAQGQQQLGLSSTAPAVTESPSASQGSATPGPSGAYASDDQPITTDESDDEATPSLASAPNIPANSHFADIDALRTTLLTVEPSDFVSRYVFEPVPFAFSNDMQLWLSWKTLLAKQLDVDPREIVLAGSASVGFSLNPKKNFRAFNEKSDLDIGLISRHYFDMAWWTLRRYNPMLGEATKSRTKAFNQHRAGHIFDGSIATDQILSLLPFGIIWKNALELMGNTPPTVGRDVNLRIYRDFESLRSYQMGSVNSLRMLLANQTPDESPILEDEK
jgi:hypothetical protein